MNASPLPLEQILDIDGDPLYRMALLLGGDERGAAELLLDLARRELRTWSPGSEQPALMAALLAAAQRREKPRTETSRREPPRNAIELPPVYRRILLLPLEQRLVLGLRLLLGYDEAHLAEAGFPAEQAQKLYDQALRALAPTARVDISDYGPEDLCDATRAALRRNSGRVNREPALRGHLATCSHCRAYDQAWGELTRSAELALRSQLRLPALPVALRTKMLAQARPKARLRRPQLRFLLPPLAVVGLIAALVLPGFWRSNTTLVEQTTEAGVDPQTLVQQALLLAEQPPSGKNGVYRARYETLWFFNDTTFAPIRAESWIDSRNPARHRIEIAHRDGGPPYEVQIGDGKERMAYRITPDYADSLYSELPASALDQLVALDAAGQNKAREVRFATGPWTIGPAYLRAAAEASDLQALGRQRDGERIVQVLSFSGTSPLGRPLDAPGATAERITVLLALDAVDGRLRRATELAGPAGAAQTSRTTWRLVNEEWIVSDATSGPVFSLKDIWAASGNEAPPVREAPIDLTLPVLDRDRIAPPAALLRSPNGQIWLPATMPPGTDRALIMWDTGLRQNSPPRAVVYLGPQRSLYLYLDRTNRGVVHQEDDSFGEWNAFLAAGRMQRYNILLQLIAPDTPMQWRDIQSQGFTRAELQAVVEGMRPFDRPTFLAQEQFFLTSVPVDQTAHAALVELLRAAPQPAADQVLYTRTKLFQRLPPPEQIMPDPYAPRPQHDTVIAEEWKWQSEGGISRLFRTSGVATGQLLYMNYISPRRSWFYNGYANTLTLLGSYGEPVHVINDDTAQTALELLSIDAPLFTERESDGSLVISQVASFREAIGDPSEYGGPYVRDVPARMAYQRLRIGANGGQVRFDTFVGNEGMIEVTNIYTTSNTATSVFLAGQTLAESVTVEETKLLSMDEAPPEIRDESVPQAALMLDLTQGFGGNIFVRSLTITEALESWPGAIYLLPEEGPAKALFAELGEKNAGISQMSPLPGSQAAANGYGILFAYSVSSGEGIDESIRITMGDAATLRAFFRAYGQNMWNSSYPMRTIVAGQTVDAWVMTGIEGNTSALFAEIDGTLIIAEGRSPWFEEMAIPMLAELRLAR
jgi:hypothetical protein